MDEIEQQINQKVKDIEEKANKINEIENKINTDELDRVSKVDKIFKELEEKEKRIDEKIKVYEQKLSEIRAAGRSFGAINQPTKQEQDTKELMDFYAVTGLDPFKDPAKW